MEADARMKEVPDPMKDAPSANNLPSNESLIVREHAPVRNHSVTKDSALKDQQLINVVQKNANYSFKNMSPKDAIELFRNKLQDNTYEMNGGTSQKYSNNLPFKNDACLPRIQISPTGSSDQSSPTSLIPAEKSDIKSRNKLYTQNLGTDKCLASPASCLASPASCLGDKVEVKNPV